LNAGAAAAVPVAVAPVSGPRENKGMTQDWSRYWRAPDVPLEAMYAHFERHVYHRHSHESYSFGVTQDGAQSFSCRGAGHTSAAGMVMAFNPDDPHDGHAANELGFTYRIVHIGAELVADVHADLKGGPAPLPLFAAPVHRDAGLAGGLTALHRALLEGASALRRDELLAAVVGSMVRRASTSRDTGAPGVRSAGTAVADRARQLIRAEPAADITARHLAEAAGCSRFAVHRAFVSAYGVTPADYQRQLRLRAARRLIADGSPIGEAAAQAGFADQSHLTRWFGRYYGITPGAYRRAVLPAAGDS
jgi:AraC-like DNA-binding protein